MVESILYEIGPIYITELRPFPSGKIQKMRAEITPNRFRLNGVICVPNSRKRSLECNRDSDTIYECIKGYSAEFTCKDITGDTPIAVKNTFKTIFTPSEPVAIISKEGL